MNGSSVETEYLPYPKGFATTAIHAGQEPEQWDSMAVIPPLVTSSTFKQYGPANFKVRMRRHFFTLSLVVLIRKNKINT